MTILESDVRIRKSQRMTDFPDGGGLMSTAEVVDGVDNNLFDDITDIQRLFGHLSLRKVYGAVLSNNADTYISAHALVDVPPTDAATDCFITVSGGLTTTRSQVVSLVTDYTNDGLDLRPINFSPGPTSPTAQSSTPYLWAPLGATLPVSAPALFFIAGVGIRWVVSVENGVYPADSSTRARWVLNENFPDLGATLVTVTVFSPFNFPVSTGATTPLYSTALVGALNSGATTIALGKEVMVFAKGPSDPVSPTLNTRLAFRPNDAILVQSTIAMSPASVSNGSTTTTGRTNLARLRVIGNNGVVHASFVANQPAPTGVGCTADLTAGTVTFSDVSGMSQPVTVEHRIEEMSLVTSMDVRTTGPTAVLSRPLSRAYPAGTRVSSLLMLGDLQARVSVVFAQQAWTGVFSDTVLGGSPAADYDVAAHPILVTNQGAVNERWYALFTNTTTFRVIGEQLGEIGTFSTGVNCSPINPATGVAYFTISATGWGSGWAAGNVLRWNTLGANAPIWAGRSVAPSTPSGSDSVTLQLRGYTNT